MTEQPKIYKAIHNILSALNVAKTGTLPGNMGGKEYMTAEAVANEAKKLFVENDLILVSNEDVTQIDTPDFGDKKTRVFLTIKGTYEAIHIEDGSSITFSGTGQGLATGTAIAANIASTFALKNALQRQFMVSEDSVDKAGHTEAAVPKQHSAQQTASAGAPPAKPVTAAAPSPLIQEIKKVMEEKNIPSERMTALNRELAEKHGKTNSEVLPELLAILQSEDF